VTETHGFTHADAGERTRLRWFYGQPVSDADLRREQAYHRDALRRHNRLVHGWGIVCGLEVEVRPASDCDPAAPDPARPTLVVWPGAVIDAAGNDIVVGTPRPVDLADLLPDAVLERLAKKPATVYLSICFCESGLDPMRPVRADACAPPNGLEYARIRETYRICASIDRPDPGPACEPCGGTGDAACIELAAIAEFDPGKPVQPGQVRGSGRRALARHRLAQISAINWVHGATYTRDDANVLLKDGFEVRLTRPVQVATLRPGVVDLTGIDAGGGRAAGIYSIAGEFRGLPSGKLTTRFTYRSSTDETVQYGDRVIITVRGDFVLDECCEPLDGDHIGGAVPLIPGTKPLPVPAKDAPVCPPRWSGNGVAGGDFVSWIHVEEKGTRR